MRRGGRGRGEGGGGGGGGGRVGGGGEEGRGGGGGGGGKEDKHNTPTSVTLELHCTKPVSHSDKKKQHCYRSCESKRTTMRSPISSSSD